MAGELEESHDTYDAEELENIVVNVHVVENAVDEERHCGDNVDDVDCSPNENAPMWTDNEPNEDLEGEPRVAYRFHVEERLVRLGALVDQLPDGDVRRQMESFIGDDRYSEVRMGF